MKTIIWLQQTGKLFPTILIILDLCAAIGYIPVGDWRKIVYWIAAGTLSAMVTF